MFFNFTLRRNDAICNVRVFAFESPAPLLQVFNFTLRRNDAICNVRVFAFESPAPLLQAAFFGNQFNYTRKRW